MSRKRKRKDRMYRPEPTPDNHNPDNPFYWCANCGGRMAVVDSRTATPHYVRRMRKCDVCGDSLSTVEIKREHYDSFLECHRELKELQGIIADAAAKGERNVNIKN